MYATLPLWMISPPLEEGKMCIGINSILCWLKMHCEPKDNFVLVNSFIKFDFL